MEHNSEWFKNWFNTKYYDLLYKHRDNEEAEHFISNFISQFQIKPASRVWDNACGNGRHCYIFSKYGFEVIGTDICEEKIKSAKENYFADNLRFYIHDMRREFYVNYFDLVVNIFTSIGYFQNVNDNEKAIKVMCNSLKKNGYILIDFFNPDYIKSNLIESETKNIQGVEFRINRTISDDWVIKNILVIDGNDKFQYTEQVKLLSKDFFVRILKNNGVNEISLYGDYKLSEYISNKSERMIFVGRK